MSQRRGQAALHHLWNDGQADRDPGDHIGHRPVGAVLGQPPQDR